MNGVSARNGASGPNGTGGTRGVPLGPVDAIPPGEGRAFALDGPDGDAEQVAVFRLRDGSVRALSARCPHAGGPLADGQSDPAKVVCPLHGRAFGFDDGECPEGGRVTVYPVAVEDGQVVLRR
jgi:nitrite reductase (NADH) small subunit